MEFYLWEKCLSRMGTKMKTFLDKRYLRKFVVDTYALPEMQKEVLQAEEKCS